MCLSYYSVRNLSEMSFQLAKLENTMEKGRSTNNAGNAIYHEAVFVLLRATRGRWSYG